MALSTSSGEMGSSKMGVCILGRQVGKLVDVGGQGSLNSRSVCKSLCLMACLQCLEPSRMCLSNRWLATVALDSVVLSESSNDTR